jgi:hypothetical protein
MPTKRLKGKSYRDAVNDDETSKSKNVAPPKDAKQSASIPKQSGPSGLIVEVVIPVYNKDASTSTASSPSPPPTTVAASSSAAEDTVNSDDESDAPRARKRRTAAKKAIIISDDEDEVDGAPSVVPRKNGRRSKGKASTSSSDYEDESAEDTASDTASASSDVASSEDESERPSKVKIKKKTPTKSKTANKKSSKKQSATSAEGSDDSMDVDEPITTKTTAKKRKADGDGKQPAKKQKRREETDPWKLESSGVKRDWTQMQAPPLEMFHFSRIVVDEYTYLDGKTHSMVTRQTGDRRWVLSGTVSQIRFSHELSSLNAHMQPPTHDFGALKTISAYLDIHLGIDDEAEGRSAQVRKRTREQTGKLAYPAALQVNLVAFSCREIPFFPGSSRPRMARKSP